MRFDRPTILTFILTFITLILWASETDFSAGLSGITSYIPPIAGITAIVFMSLDFISSTRFRFLEKLAGGLDILYRFHGYIGKLGAVILLAHPTFLLIDRGLNLDGVQRFFLPGSIEFFNWGIYAFWLLLLLVILTIFIKIPYRWWLITHRLMVLVYLFAAYHVFLDYTNAARSPGLTIKEGWILGIILLGLFALVYKEFIYPFIAGNYEVTKVNVIGLVTEVYMKAKKKRLNFVPGEYIFMAVMNNKDLTSETHPFGITSSTKDDEIRVSIKALGDYTNKANLIKQGDLVKVWGPYGMFNWNNFDKYKKQVWIGGGIGIAPFLAMFKYANEIKSDKDITLYYVEKNAGESEYTDELEKLAEGSKVKYIQRFDDEAGFLTAQIVSEEVGDLSDAAILICGPSVMMRVLREQFLALGLKRDQIKEEEFAMKR